MGQQQLLLLVLGAVVVGLAIILGINMFAEGTQKAQMDNVKQELTQMAARAEEWWRKPTMLGGGGKLAALTNFDTFAQLGYLSDYLGAPLANPVIYNSEIALYTLTPGAGGVATITATIMDPDKASRATLGVVLTMTLTVTNPDSKAARLVVEITGPAAV